MPLNENGLSGLNRQTVKEHYNHQQFSEAHAATSLVTQRAEFDALLSEAVGSSDRRIGHEYAKLLLSSLHAVQLLEARQ